jgi:hypothetical protein
VTDERWGNLRGTGRRQAAKGGSVGAEIILIRQRPQDAGRVPMNVHLEAREGLSTFLLTDLAGTGVGFSEFLMLAVDLWRKTKPVLKEAA